MKIGPCAKRIVSCLIVSRSGETFRGENWCMNAQPVCPRRPGEGYEKCVTICQQFGHAEIDALRIAGAEADGGHAFLSGHTYACQSCQEALFSAGIRALSVAPS
jgi:hypothetical protein